MQQSILNCSLNGFFLFYVSNWYILSEQNPYNLAEPRRRSSWRWAPLASPICSLLSGSKSDSHRLVVAHTGRTETENGLRESKNAEASLPWPRPTTDMAHRRHRRVSFR